MQQSQQKLIPTMINFHETYKLMKTYLSKKRFSYVYQACLKFYSKNQTFFTNHEVLMIIRLVSYVLNKKIIPKVSDNRKWQIQSLAQIYNVMKNVYFSWEKVLTVQMNAEDASFFNMIHRSRQLNKKASDKMEKYQAKRPDIYLFEAKKDFVITKKINTQFKIFSFFKHSLRMLVNTLKLMVPCLSVCNIDRLLKTINLAEGVAKKFNQHQFPLQKLQFYLIKCQIILFLKRQQVTNHNVQVNYEFPVGFFQLVYRNLQQWKEAKLCHHIGLLFMVAYTSVKNQLIEVKDAYILVNELKLLIFIFKKKDFQSFQKRESDPETETPKTDINFRPSRNSFLINKNDLQHSIRRHSTQKKQIERQGMCNDQSKSKSRNMAIIKCILEQIQKDISNRYDIAHILRVYMEPTYKKYKQNPTHYSDQIIDQIPLLTEKSFKKTHPYKSAKSSVDQIQNRDTQLYQNKFLQLNETYYEKPKKDSYPQGQTEQETVSGHSQNLLKKNNKIILKNIFNVKNQKLKITNKCQLDRLNNNKINLPSKLPSCSLSGENQIKFPYNQFLSTIINATLNQVNVLQAQSNKHEPLELFEQSSSDEENEVKLQFEAKRRSLIQQINNNYSKRFQPNYIVEQEQTNNFEAFSIHQQERSMADQQINEGLITEDDINQSHKKKISNDLEFDQIKLLDEVIKQKIFNYLDLEILSQTPGNSLQSVSSAKRITSKQFIVTPFSMAWKSTQKLKSQIGLLNKKRSLIIQQLKYKSSTANSDQSYTRLEGNDEFDYSFLKGFEKIYNTHKNLTKKVNNSSIQQKKKQLKMNEIDSKKFIFNQILKRQENFCKSNEQLSMIGELEDEDELTQRKVQVSLLDYAKNKSVSLLDQKLKRKEQQTNLNCVSNNFLGTAQNQEIALRQHFSNLRINISKTQFNEVNNLNKISNLKLNVQ